MTDLLKSTPVIAIASTPILFIDQELSISEALEYLAANNILSVLVLDVTKNECRGSVDVLDMLTFALSFPQGTTFNSATLDGTLKSKMQTPIKNVIGCSKSNPFLPIHQHTPIADVVSDVFWAGVHRVPIVDSNNNVLAILSQSDVVRFIANGMKINNQLEQLGKLTIEGLGILPSKVIVVDDRKTLFEAFQLIIDTGVSGIAVVNSKGRLCGSLSATDFAGVTETNWLQLEMPVAQFIATQAIIYAKKDTYFYDAVQLLVANRIHRVYIVDPNMFPLGVITMTDVLRVVCNLFQLSNSFTITGITVQSII